MTQYFSEMREACSVVLSEVIQCCEPYKYTVIEAFNIVRSTVLKPTCPTRRLRSSNMLLFVAHLRSNYLRLRTVDITDKLWWVSSHVYDHRYQQLFLSLKHRRAERVLQLPVVHHWVAALKQPEPTQKIVALTNFNFYLLTKPEGM